VKLNIKKVRENLKLTQVQLATKVGLSVRYFQSIENGERKPSIDVLSTIAKTLKISIHELIDD
jgi:transcriptional regulator with XRE-family HTH domain